MEVGETYRGRIRNICVDDKINKATFGYGVCTPAAVCVYGEGKNTRKAHIFCRPLQWVFLCAANDL